MNIDQAIIKSIFFTFITVWYSQMIFAHPSWGIVTTSDQDVYFVDVLHHNGTLWKYDPGDCTIEAIFSGNFHSHGIHIDDEDNLYIGIQLWIDGMIMGDGQNMILKYSTRTNSLDTLLYTESYYTLNGTNIYYQPEDSNYFYTHEKQIRKGNLKDKSTMIAHPHRFERISTIKNDNVERLWICDSYADGGSLYYLTPEMVLVHYAHHLIPEDPESPVYEERNHQLLYGISFTAERNPIITQSADRSVTIISPDGKKEVLYQSPPFYFPTGVTESGDYLIIMEVGFIPGKGHQGPRLVILHGQEKQVVEIDKG